MKVSIIIPVYNVSNYVDRCIKSVIKQSYTDVECILVNDCSVDDSLFKIEDILSKYKGNINFIVKNHDVNLGVSAARNTGMKVATGHYIYFLDGDDEITPDSISYLVDLAMKYPEVDFVHGNILQDGKVVSRMSLDGMGLPEYLDDSVLLQELLLTSLPSIACNKLLKKDFIFEYNLFFKEGIIHEDFYWTFFLAKYVRKVAFSMEYSYLYYKNPGSITTKLDYKAHRKRYLSRKTFTIDFLENLDDGYILKIQKGYICANLLVCNEELMKMRDLKEYFQFWKFVISLVKTYKWRKIYEIIYVLHLLPPLCFVSSLKFYKWRLIEKVVTKIF